MAEREQLEDNELGLPEEGEGGEEAAEKLALEVKIDARGACQRHITVTIPHSDVDRYFDKEYSKLMSDAQVPGFRPGHAPRKLVEARFRKDVAEKVKSELLSASMAQISQSEDLSPISEPDLDLEAVEVPADGPMTYEFNLEVRPQFDVPQWKGMTLEKPVRQFSERDVEVALKNHLARLGKLVPLAGPAEVGDYLATGLKFTYEGKVLSSSDEEVIRIRPVLSFRDGNIEGFDKLMRGVKAGQTREAQVTISADAPNEALRGKQVTAAFEVKEVKRLELPELTPQFLDELGGFESEAELKDAILDELQRQLEYQQHRRAREQITKALTVTATWELPPELLKRQAHRELSRAVLELQRSGFSEEQIRAHENELRQNSLASTARALKEHFILEKIAEDQKIEETEEDYEQEIRLIAEQSGQTPRRVRAQLEKSGRMDVLRNQIIERKTIERIMAHATFKEVPYQPASLDAEALGWTMSGGESDIPEAHEAGPAEGHGEGHAHPHEHP